MLAPDVFSLLMPIEPVTREDSSPRLSRQSLLRNYASSLEGPKLANQQGCLARLQISQQKLMSKTCQPDDLLVLQDAADVSGRKPVFDEGLPAQAVWSNKYKPLTTAELVGNAAVSEELKGWLEAWSSVDEHKLAKADPLPCTSYTAISDSDDDWVQDSVEDATSHRGPQKAALVSGPVGGGKTALVYAVAKEAGMRVTEVGVGHKAKGSQLHALVGEALQSCSLPMQGLPKAEGLVADAACTEENTLILFDDIDVQLQMDPSLLPPLARLVSTSKRPVVMTCHTSSAMCLSPYVDPVCLTMQQPTAEAVLELLVMVAACEDLSTSVNSLTQLAISCQQDIRHTLLTAQFWGGHLPSNQAAMLSCPQTRQQWRDNIWAAISCSSDAAQQASASSPAVPQVDVQLPWCDPDDPDNAAERHYCPTTALCDIATEAQISSAGAEDRSASIDRLTWLRKMAACGQEEVVTSGRRRIQQRQHPLCIKLGIPSEMVEKLATESHCRAV